jgi:ribosome biogenesis GTPase
VIDTPGLRELGLWTNGAGTAAAFDDVEALAADVPLRRLPPPDRARLRRPAGLEDGRLPAERFAAWEKLQRELAWAERRQTRWPAATRRRHDRAMSKLVRAHNLHRGRD